ncbi:wolframin-like [Uloborus diversus]|uniref:wolframin-like n=1 Tax=Uloborus diversus TaxID=327109 RepID=UPI0024095B12|nr:wolframin-like [Uloborus diversus]
MPERHQARSISRTLLLPRQNLGTLRLRHILAEDGCKESQVALAKSLLTNPASTSEEREFNSQLAVHWLLQAAKEGQEEAVSILRECANAGIGTNAVNYLEIEKCLKYTEEEKISRRVASSIFRAIMSDTEDVISEEIFREQTEKILQEENEFSIAKTDNDDLMQHKEPCLKKSEEPFLRTQTHVSFSEVVNSVQSCLEGNVPLVSLKQVTQYNHYKTLFLTKYAVLFWHIILNSLQDLIEKFASFTVLCTIFSLCFLLEITCHISSPGSQFYLFIIKCRMFFATLLCLSTMISTTCFVICISFGADSMKKWLHLIKFFEPSVRSDAIEIKYLMKTAPPLMTFFIVSLMYISILPMNTLPSGFNDLAVLSLLFVVFVDRTITHQRYYVNVSLILNILTCLYKSNVLQKLSIATLSYFDFDIVYEITSKLEVHLNLISCLTLPFVLPYLYTKMALGNEWKGWHLVLLPHLMCVTWLNLAFIHLAEVSETTIIFSVIFWLVILVLSKYLGIFFALCLYIFTKLLMLNAVNVEIFLVLPALFILYLLSAIVVKRFKVSHNSKLCTLLMCVFVVLLSYQAAKPHELSSDVNSDPVLSWNKYETHCHHHAWYKTNTAEVQISCLPLKGRKISVEGTVTAIDVVNVRNSLKTFIDVLPNPFNTWFTCALGQTYTSCDFENADALEKERCKLYETLNLNECHLQNWDVYTYRITLEVSARTSPEIVVMTSHVCSEFVRNLKEGDSLQIVGVLESNIGGTVPIFTLEKAHCSSCYSVVDCDTSFILPQPSYSASFKNIIWFYFSPFVQYVSTIDL